MNLEKEHLSKKFRAHKHLKLKQKESFYEKRKYEIFRRIRRMPESVSLFCPGYDRSDPGRANRRRRTGTL